MAHLELYVVAPPDRHKDLQRELNEWRYETEGKLFKGHSRPFVSTAVHYDVRIREEHVEKFIRDFRVKTWETKKSVWNDSNMSDWKLHKIRWLMKLFWMVTPFKGAKGTPGEPQFTHRHWYYAFLIGKVKDDPLMDSAYKSKKEVL